MTAQTETCHEEIRLQSSTRWIHFSSTPSSLTHTQESVLTPFPSPQISIIDDRVFQVPLRQATRRKIKKCSHLLSHPKNPQQRKKWGCWVSHSLSPFSSKDSNCDLNTSRIKTFLTSQYHSNTTTTAPFLFSPSLLSSSLQPASSPALTHYSPTTSSPATQIKTK